MNAALYSGLSTAMRRYRFGWNTATTWLLYPWTCGRSPGRCLGISVGMWA
ncbi:MAG: hypothetical protein R2715_09170 [Ilumatobacteraceae bacterium]